MEIQRDKISLFVNTNSIHGCGKILEVNCAGKVVSQQRLLLWQVNTLRHLQTVAEKRREGRRKNNPNYLFADNGNNFFIVCLNFH